MYKRLFIVFVALFVASSALADIASTTFFTGGDGVTVSSTGQISANDTIARKTDIGKVPTGSASSTTLSQMWLE